MRQKAIAPLLLGMKLLLIKVPKEPTKEGESPKDFKETMSVAEQLFASLSAISKKGFSWYGQDYITLEIVSKNDQISFYIGCPDHLISLVSRQIQSYYPAASVEQVLEYSIFEQEGELAATTITLTRDSCYPIKTYQDLESDPLNAITNALTRVGKEGAAAIQILIQPTGIAWTASCKNIARNISKGKPPKTGAIQIMGELLNFARSQKDEGQAKITPLQEKTIEAIENKASKIGFKTTIRIIVNEPTELLANQQLSNIASAFAQFSAPQLNSFVNVKKKKLQEIIQNYILRKIGGKSFVLNTEELASIFHFPNRFLDTPNVNWLLARHLAAPSNLPTEGLILGKNA